MQLFKLSHNQLKKYWQQYFELTIWIAALTVLFFMKIDTHSPSLCLFRFLGFQHCPGCGLGHAISAALHLHFAASLQYHPLGIVAIIIILNRIKQLTFKPK